MTVLVTGARGSVGSAVLDGLRAAGVPVRASTRDPGAGGLPAGVAVVQGDLAAPQTFAAMLDGVQAVFLYASDAAPEAFAAAAREAGVEHVVLMSSHTVQQPHAEANPIAALHLRAERALTESGLAWTFVRPGHFATNTRRWTTIRTERVVRTAFPDGRSSPVHERDIAGVAVAALTDARWRGRALLVPGPGLTTLREQVAAIADAIGEPVRVEQQTVEAYREDLLRHLTPAIADLLIAARGDVPQAPDAAEHDAVPLVLGRPALTYADWACDHADDFR